MLAKWVKDAVVFSSLSVADVSRQSRRRQIVLAFDVMLETGVLIDPLPLWEDELKRPETFSNPTLIENIKREGLRL